MSEALSALALLSHLKDRERKNNTSEGKIDSLYSISEGSLLQGN